MSDLDDYLTSEASEQQVTDWMKALCHQLAEVGKYQTLYNKKLAYRGLHNPVKFADNKTHTQYDF